MIRHRSFRPVPAGLTALVALLGVAGAAPRPLAAQGATVRDAAQILAYPVAGVSLDTPADEARAVLAADGFVEVSIFGPPSAPAGWNYEKGMVRVELRHTGGVLTRVERTEQGRADSDTVDVEGPAAHIRSYFGLADEDCQMLDAAVSCSVADAEGRPTAVATAQLVPHRTIVRVTRLPGG